MIRHERKIPSALGLSVDITQPVTDMRVLLEGDLTELLTIRLDFAQSWSREVERWVKSYFGKIIGWFVKWVVRIFLELVQAVLNALLTVGGTLLLDGVQTLAPNLLEVEFNDFTLTADALATHVPVAPGDPATRLEVGLRRLNSSTPRVDEVDYELEFHAPSCQDVVAPNDLPGWILGLIRCPLEIVQNVIRFVTYPFTYLLSSLVDYVTDISGAINELLRDTVVDRVADLEKDNVLSALISSSVGRFTLEPYFLDTVSVIDPPPVPNPAGGVPDPYVNWGLAHLCSLAGEPKSDCLIAQLYDGTTGKVMNELDAEVSPGLLRLGAKTHYRSLEGYPRVPEQVDRPPVRFCVEGDDPEDLLSYDSDDLDRLADFREVDASAVRDPKPHDWRTQCSLFGDFDFRVSMHGMIKDLEHPGVIEYGLRVVPTERTNFLVNEVFVCTSSNQCDIGPDKPIRDRATLALCSMAADAWYYWRCDQGWKNLALDAGHDVRALLETFAAKAGFSDEDLDAIEARLGTCKQMLEDHGWNVSPNFPLPNVAVCDN